jgi:dTDP-glucose 4,6-dehydratase
MKLLVCGGAGFIGSNFVRQRLGTSDDEVVVLDKLTYAGRRETLRDVESEPRFSFIHGAIEDADAVAQAIAGVQAVVNFAAETHLHTARGGPRTRRSLPPGLDRRGLRLDRGGLVQRDLAARAVLPL